MRVLLLDEGFSSGSITAQGLRSAGCDVDVMAATGGSARCAAHRGTWTLAPRVGDPRLLDVIERAVGRGRHDVVYPVTEPLNRLLWEASPAWATRVFPLVVPAHRPARLDKRAMSALVAAAGVSVPPEMPAATSADVDAAVARLGLPVVIKGAWGRGGDATHVCATPRDANRASRHIGAMGRTPFAQRYVEGDTCLAGGLFDAGSAIRYYAGRKSVQFPQRVGPAAEIVSLHDAALQDAATRVFAAANVTGLASADFIRDRSGSVHFLELNPRPWGSIGAAAAAGVDLFRALVDLWRGARVAPQLSFTREVSTPVFPLYMLDRRYWSTGRAAHALGPDLRRAASFVRREPALAGHLVHRMVRVGMNW